MARDPAGYCQFFGDIANFSYIKLIAFALLACDFQEYQAYRAHTPRSQFEKLLHLSLQFSSLLGHKLFAFDDGNPSRYSNHLQDGLCPPRSL